MARLISLRDRRFFNKNYREDDDSDIDGDDRRRLPMLRERQRILWKKSAEAKHPRAFVGELLHSDDDEHERVSVRHRRVARKRAAPSPATQAPSPSLLASAALPQPPQPAPPPPPPPPPPATAPTPDVPPVASEPSPPTSPSVSSSEDTTTDEQEYVCELIHDDAPDNKIVDRRIAMFMHIDGVKHVRIHTQVTYTDSTVIEFRAHDVAVSMVPEAFLRATVAKMAYKPDEEMHVKMISQFLWPEEFAFYCETPWVHCA